MDSDVPRWARRELVGEADDGERVVWPHAFAAFDQIGLPGIIAREHLRNGRLYTDPDTGRKWALSWGGEKQDGKKRAKTEVKIKVERPGHPPETVDGVQTARRSYVLVTGMFIDEETFKNKLREKGASLEMSDWRFTRLS